MSTAVATKTKRTYQLIARGRNNRLVRQGQDDRDMLDGRKIRVADRVDYDFAPHGHLTLIDGQDVLADGPPDPLTGEPTEQDAITWLKSGYRHPGGSYGPHPYFNTRVWIEGEEPDRPRPLEDDFMDRVTDALAGLDPGPLEELLAAEVATHNRPTLVHAAEGALRKIKVVKAGLAEQAGAATVNAEQAQADPTAGAA